MPEALYSDEEREYTKVVTLILVLVLLTTAVMAHTGHQEHDEAEVQQNATSGEEQQVQQITSQYPDWTLYAAGAFIALTAVLVIVGLNLYSNKDQDKA